MMKAVVFVVVLIVLGLGAAVIAVAARRKPSDLDLALRQHARYTVKAAKASRRGKDGESNVYTEAARDVWKHIDDRTRVAPRAATKSLTERQRKYFTDLQKIRETTLR